MIGLYIAIAALYLSIGTFFAVGLDEYKNGRGTQWVFFWPIWLIIFFAAVVAFRIRRLIELLIERRKNK